jgi:hypothetical protein
VGTMVLDCRATCAFSGTVQMAKNRTSRNLAFMRTPEIDVALFRPLTPKIGCARDQALSAFCAWLDLIMFARG